MGLVKSDFRRASRASNLRDGADALTDMSHFLSTLAEYESRATSINVHIFLELAQPAIILSQTLPNVACSPSIFDIIQLVLSPVFSPLSISCAVSDLCNQPARCRIGIVGWVGVGAVKCAYLRCSRPLRQWCVGTKHEHERVIQRGIADDRCTRLDKVWSGLRLATQEKH